MLRPALLAAIGVLALVLGGPVPSSSADPAAEETAFQTQLAVQRAMEQGKQHLAVGEYARAVEALELHIARINGNSTYLRLLRDAYRGLIRDLIAAQQPQAAEKYRLRLGIIDGTPAPDSPLTLTATDRKAPVVDAAIKPAARTEFYTKDPKQSGPAPIARAKSEDPFDIANRREPDASDRQKVARTLLGQAESAYSQARFAQARLFYDQAHQAHPAALNGSEQRWAYCKMIAVIDQLKQPSLDVTTLASLHREVQAAMSLFPGLKDHGQPVLAKIEEMANGAPMAPAASVNGALANAARRYEIKHLGADNQGWQVTETTHFRIIHKQARELVVKVADVAEKTRYEMYQKWFGIAGPEWSPKCDIHLHATAQEYAHATGVSPSSPGHARIETERGGRVIGRRLEMHVDNPAMLDAILPHETTHVVLAGMFGSKPVPRWADEGMAVLTEPADKIELQRRNLVRSQRDGLLFKVRDLMNLPDYPHARQVGAFYAQSVVLVEFLTRQKGPQVFATFVRDGLKEGYDTALRKHYGWDFNALQDQWNRHLTAELTRLAPAVAER